MQYPFKLLKLRQEFPIVYEILLFLDELIIYFCCHQREYPKAAPFSESILPVLIVTSGNTRIHNHYFPK